LGMWRIPALLPPPVVQILCLRATIAIITRLLVVTKFALWVPPAEEWILHLSSSWA
jgi:hypothetical protein